MTPGTLGFDESEHAGPEHLDADYVAGYDRKAATDPDEDVRAMRDAGIGERSVVVDLGAGTGTFAAAIAPWCREVIAVDVSAPMRAATRERCRELGLKNVRCVEAGFLSYDHEGPPADGVYSRNALHHLPDFWKAVALTRIAGFLAPGGVLRLRDLVYSFEPLEAEAVLERWYAGASAWRCLARYADGTPWYSASRAAGSAESSGSTASSVHTCTPHSTPSDSLITRIVAVRDSGQIRTQVYAA